MKNLWDEVDAAALDGPLGDCIYASHLIGGDPSLVLHGGGNTSAKTIESDVFGAKVEVLWVKASGWDLDEITVEGFSPLYLDRIKKLGQLESLPDEAMTNELLAARVNASSPGPSVESFIHAIIPDAAVLHSHSDALLAISNTADGRDRLESIFGSRVVIVPYERPGFRVGRTVAVELSKCRTNDTVAVILMNHGIVTFGDTHRVAYDRMISLVTEVEEYLEVHAGSAVAIDSEPSTPAADRVGLAQLRLRISKAAGRPFILSRDRAPASQAFGKRTDVARLTEQGPATPDHVIWTKTFPMVGLDVDAYVSGYEAYYNDHRHLVAGSSILDPAPRIIIDKDLGMLTAGPDTRSADAARDIYRQTIWVMEHAAGLGGYVTLPPSDFFEVEYWALEQAKLKQQSVSRDFTGEIAVVTGAASGIGKACALELLERGAAVVGLDISPVVSDVASDSAFLGVQCDLTSRDSVEVALDEAIERFGGIDMLVLAAGIFPKSEPIATQDPANWQKAMAVNVDALLQLLALAHPLLSVAPNGGRVTVIGSKNVVAPGPGASAYSASKAAANQLTRVAALEWAADGIRVNSVHPDAVFDTALWTEELLAERAAHYGLSVEAYKTRNLLGVEITSSDVALVVADTLGRSFSRITGAHIPIDGGNDRVI